MPNLTGILIALFSACVYGLFPPTAKLAYAHGANPVFMILVTTFFRANFLAGYSIYKGQTLIPLRNKYRLVVASGFYQSISIVSILASLQFIPGPVMIIILFSHTIMLLFFMAYRNEIELTTSTVSMTLLALLGLSFVLDFWSQTNNINWIGVTLALIGAIATFNRLYIFGKQTIEIPPAVVGAQTFSAAFIFLPLILFYQTPTLPRDGIGYLWVLCCCMSLALGSFGMFFGIAKLGSFRWSLFSKMEPIFTAIFSLLLLGEVLEVLQYLGMLLVLGSLVLYQVLEQRTKTVPIDSISTDPAAV